MSTSRNNSTDDFGSAMTDTSPRPTGPANNGSGNGTTIVQEQIIGILTHHNSSSAIKTAGNSQQSSAELPSRLVETEPNPTPSAAHLFFDENGIPMSVGHTEVVMLDTPNVSILHHSLTCDGAGSSSHFLAAPQLSNTQMANTNNATTKSTTGGSGSSLLATGNSPRDWVAGMNATTTAGASHRAKMEGLSVPHQAKSQSSRGLYPTAGGTSPLQDDDLRPRTMSETATDHKKSSRRNSPRKGHRDHHDDDDDHHHHHHSRRHHHRSRRSRSRSPSFTDSSHSRRRSRSRRYSRDHNSRHSSSRPSSVRRHEHRDGRHQYRNEERGGADRHRGGGRNSRRHNADDAEDDYYGRRSGRNSYGGGGRNSHRRGADDEFYRRDSLGDDRNRGGRRSGVPQQGNVGRKGARSPPRRYDDDEGRRSKKPRHEEPSRKSAAGGGGRKSQGGENNTSSGRQQQQDRSRPSRKDLDAELDAFFK